MQLYCTVTRAAIETVLLLWESMSAIILSSMSALTFLNEQVPRHKGDSRQDFLTKNMSEELPCHLLRLHLLPPHLRQGHVPVLGGVEMERL